MATLSLAALLAWPLPSHSLPVSSPPIAQVTSADLTVVGPLKLGMDQDEVAKVLGLPQSGKKPKFVPATGAYSKQWDYPDQGASLTLSGDREQGPFELEAISLESPSTLPAAAGICVGMLETEAFNRFKTLVTEDINSYEASEDQFGVMANSSYQAVVAECADGVVKRLYIGPGPE